MRIVVTGGAGFIGSCLIWKLNNKGIRDIIVVDCPAFFKGKNLANKDIEDCIDKDKFLGYLENNKIKMPLDAIIHFGARTSTTESNLTYLVENNYLYSKILANWALAKNIPFLYASSAATYGAGEFGYSDEDKITLKLNPLNFYGYSKHLFDLWLIKNRLSNKVTGFKFFNVFGPNEYHKQDMRSLITKVFDKVAKGEKLRLFKSYKKEFADGEQKRDFIYIKDAIEIVYYFIEHPNITGIYNVGCGNSRTWNDIAKALFSALGLKPNIEYIEMPIELRSKYQYFTQADLSKLKKIGLNHKFFTLEDAVWDYVGYLKNHSYL